MENQVAALCHLDEAARLLGAVDSSQEDFIRRKLTMDVMPLLTARIADLKSIAGEAAKPAKAKGGKKA